MSLVPFTAIAVTTVQLPWFPSNFDFSRQPTAIGFLSYDPHGSDRIGFDLGIRVRTYGERGNLLTRWTALNVPPGLCVGWNLRADHASFASSLKDRPLVSLCQKPGTAGLISLKNAVRHGHDLTMVSADAGIECDMRNPAERLDDYYTSSYERAAAAIILDTVAIFRLALGNVLGELRGGASLRHEIETQMAASLGEMIRQALSDVPILSHLLEGPANVVGMASIAIPDACRRRRSIATDLAK